MVFARQRGMHQRPRPHAAPLACLAAQTQLHGRQIGLRHPAGKREVFDFRVALRHLARRHHLLKLGMGQVGVDRKEIAHAIDHFGIGHHALGDGISGGAHFIDEMQLCYAQVRLVLLLHQAIRERAPHHGHPHPW